jgi:two-component system NtrC family response regulator
MNDLWRCEAPQRTRLLRARGARHAAVRHANTILVIEDDAELRRLLDQALARAGYTVVAARSGGEAIDWLGLSVFDGTLENTPALIVSDIRLPDFSGLDLLDVMVGTLHDVPIILITGFPSPETSRAAAELGAARVLEKPLELDALRAAVAEVLRERRGLRGPRG